MTIEAVPNHVSEASKHAVRLDKVRRLKEMGIDPWPASYPPVKHTTQDVLAPGASGEFTVAGRIVSSRGHGKTTFAHIIDRAGKLQLYFKKDALGEERFSILHHLIDV